MDKTIDQLIDEASLVSLALSYLKIECGTSTATIMHNKAAFSAIIDEMLLRCPPHIQEFAIQYRKQHKQP